MKRIAYRGISLLTIALLFLAACVPSRNSSDKNNPYRLGAIFPGVITDADYNSMGFLGTEAVKRDLKIETAYKENVSVSDLERTVRDFVLTGSNIIWVHGGQFLDKTIEMSNSNPEIIFIVEGDAKPDNLPGNVWFIDRNAQIGFYGIGALAARTTITKKVGYIGGVKLPLSYSEVHAIQQAINDYGEPIELIPIWTGDFNDPYLAHEVSNQMILDGVDVIIGSLNLGMQGVFESVKENKDRKVLVTAKYSDKSQFAPNNYITSLLYDFSKPLKDIVSKIKSGEKSGYYPLGFDTGVRLQTPLTNVPPSVSITMEEIINKLVAGKIQVVKDVSPIE